MWSSISSYLYDESNDDSVEPKSAQNRGAPPTTPRTRTRIPITAAIKAGNRRDNDRRTIINAVDATASGSRGGGHVVVRDTLQTSVHSTSSSTTKNKINRHHANKSSATAAAAAASSSSSDNTTIIRGIIVGEEQSGKTCLIRRLRGEDPFQVRGRGGQSSSVADNNNEKKREKRNVMALIPWKLPEALFQPNQQHHTTTTADSEELVQLYMSEGKSFCYSNKERSFPKQWSSVVHSSHRGKGCNFIVWMVDPRMDCVVDFVREGLDILFPSTVVVRDHDKGNNGNDEGKKGAHIVISKQPLIQHLCILLNFRDIDPAPLKEGQKSQVDQVQCIVAEVMDRYNTNHLEENQSLTTTTDSTIPIPTISVYESSMKNCYGLQNLHSFITLPYLAHKERELRRRAEHARKQHAQWTRGLAEEKVVEYSEFVEQIRGDMQERRPTKESTERQKLEEEKERLQQRLKRQNELLRSKMENKVGVEGESVSDRANQRGEAAAATPSKALPGNQSEKGVKEDMTPTPSKDDKGQRKLFAKPRQSEIHSVAKKAVPSPDVTNNLDSFFSDDEEEDDYDLAESDTNSIGNYSSDSSNDGDFFIDVSGARCAHANAAPFSQRHASTKGKEKIEKKTPEVDVGTEVVGHIANDESGAQLGSKDGSAGKNSTESSSSPELGDNKGEDYQSTTVDNDEAENELDGIPVDESASSDTRGTTDGAKMDVQSLPDTSESDARLLKNAKEPDAAVSAEEAQKKSVAGDHLDDITDAKHDAMPGHSTLEHDTASLENSEEPDDDVISVEEATEKSVAGDKSNDTSATKSDVMASCDTLEDDTHLLENSIESNNAISVEESPKKPVVGDDHDNTPVTNGDAMTGCDILEPDTRSVNDSDESDAVVSIEEADNSDEAVTEHTAVNTSIACDEIDRSLQNSGDPEVAISAEEDTTSEGAGLECAQEKSIAGGNHDDAPGELTTEQSPTDNSTDPSNDNAGAMENELKVEHQKGRVDDEGEATLSDDTDRNITETEDMQKHDLIEKNLQQPLVMDSDEDSVGHVKESPHDGKKNNVVESDGSDEGLITGNRTYDDRQPREYRGKSPSMPTQQKRLAGITTPAKSAQVSTLAMAAIEAARREAEQLLASSQPDAPPAKREKKKKKKKDGEKKKKKKKDKMPKD